MSFLGDPSVGMMGGGTYWDVSTASYASKSNDVSAQADAPVGLFFNVDGTKLFIAQSGGSDYVYQYTLSTAWDVSTASYDSKSKDVTAQVSSIWSVAFSYDGTKMYVVDRILDKVFQYTLSTAWDVSTASYASKSADVSAKETDLRGLCFSTDGTGMYVVGADSIGKVFQYTLSTAWDVSTASYSKEKNVSAEATNHFGLFFGQDGKKMYLLQSGSQSIFQYTLSTAWDVSTASYDSKNKSLSAQTGNPYNIFFNPNGGGFYAVGGTVVYQYTLAG